MIEEEKKKERESTEVPKCAPVVKKGCIEVVSGAGSSIAADTVTAPHGVA